jgi:hypothetical protein
VIYIKGLNAPYTYVVILPVPRPVIHYSVGDSHGLIITEGGVFMASENHKVVNWAMGILEALVHP